MKKLFDIRAPTRIDFAGGTTDIKFFIEDSANKKGGATFNGAINLEARASVYETNKSGLSVRSNDLETSFSAYSADSIRCTGNLRLLKAIVKQIGIVPDGILIETESEAPPESGLGSSAAIGVAFAGALYAIIQNSLELDDEKRKKIAETAIQAEWGLGIIGGKQDQYASAFGGANLWRFKGSRVERDPVCPEYTRPINNNLILCYTGVSRVSGDMNGNMKDNYEKNEKGVRGALMRIRDIAEEMHWAVKAGSIGKLIYLMNEETRQRAKLHPSIVNNRLKEIIECAMQNRVLGAKVLGAGGGGCVLFYAEQKDYEQIKDALTRKGCWILNYKFDEKGLEIIK